MTDEKKVLELFCGCGGLGEGLKQSGVHVDVAMDFNSDAVAAYRLNHPDTLVLERNLAEFGPEALQQEVPELRPGSLSLLCGGPPCQGFSSQAPKEVKRKPWGKDPRNRLMFRFLDYVDYFLPDCVLIENVPGLLTKRGAVEYIMGRLEGAGYNAGHRVLNAADYGAPQVRKRVFFLASRVGIIEFPRPTHADIPKGQGSLFRSSIRPWRTVREAFAELAEHPDAPDNEEPKHSVKTIEKISRLKPGESLYETFKSSWYRLDFDRPSNTVNHMHRGGSLHPVEHRINTIRELAQLQGFRWDYRFEGSTQARGSQVSNAVAVPMAAAIGRAIKKHISGFRHE
jgi:DNA (cytosine-5)-methyltransferase 1